MADLGPLAPDPLGPRIAAIFTVETGGHVSYCFRFTRARFEKVSMAATVAGEWPADTAIVIEAARAFMEEAWCDIARRPDRMWTARIGNGPEVVGHAGIGPTPREAGVALWENVLGIAP